MKKKITSLIAGILMLAIIGGGCGGNGPKGSGDEEYEAQIIQIEGLRHEGKDSDTIEEITIGELRKLPQYRLDASYKRTTGMSEEFQMEGPYIREIISHLGGELSDYAGIGVIGRDGYYCLLSKEVIDATPDLMLALVIDGEAKLDEDKAPAHLAVQGQYGPYWVKMVEKIILYEHIPEKEISSVWVFSALAEGIEPFEYEYYGSKDAAIEIGQIFTRLDYVDSKAFFTMKSADGFKKNEAVNIVKSRYYIKVEGKDAPTNISPYIKLGMNVHNIAWISTNQDAAVFPNKLAEYMELADIGGHKGILLSELLYETEADKLRDETFHVLGTEGEKITVSGEDLAKGILVPGKDGSAGVVWDKAAGYPDIEKLLRIRKVKGNEAGGNEAGGNEAAEKAAAVAGSGKAGPDTVLAVTGDGVKNPRYFSLNDLRAFAALSSKNSGYVEQIFSIVNNWPTKKFQVAKGVDLNVLLSAAGLKAEAASFRVEAKDGYYAELTREQLLGRRYYYPGLLEGKTAGAVQVKPMAAFACETGTVDLSKALDCDLRLIIGQMGLSDVNTAPSVQNMVEIKVSVKSGGKWPAALVSMEEGALVFRHENMDQVKLHYTFDGSDPDYNSPVYNPSTSYFQPDLIKPIPVTGTGAVKVKAIGYGKLDSEVMRFDY
ncbi:hypothetical protein MASR2M70_09300 [Bacillota bacterium]